MIPSHRLRNEFRIPILAALLLWIVPTIAGDQWSAPPANAPKEPEEPKMVCPKTGGPSCLEALRDYTESFYALFIDKVSREDGKWKIQGTAEHYHQATRLYNEMKRCPAFGDVTLTRTFEMTHKEIWFHVEYACLVDSDAD